MRITFAFFGALSLFAAGLLFLGAKSAIHEILAALFVLMFLICAATASVLGALAKLQSPALSLPPRLPVSDPTPATASIFPEPPPKQGGNWVKVGK